MSEHGDDLRREVGQLRTEMDHLSAYATDTRRLAAGTSEELGGAGTFWRQQFDLLQALQVTQSDHYRSIRQLDTKVDTLDTKVDTLTDRVDTLTDRVDILALGQAEHTRILTGHGQILTGHTQTLHEHGDMLRDHGDMLREILRRLPDPTDGTA